ncbi:MAG: S8 family serine peptidase [Micromonosporaceae bacterium]
MSLGRAGSALVAVLAVLVAPLVASPAYADEVRDKQWNLEMLGAHDAWEHSRGDGVVVAVLDSGVDAGHPDLAGQVLEGHDVVEGGTATSDADGHGTAVAAMIAGHDDDAGVAGLAPEAKILPVAVGGERMYDDDIAEGIRWAVDHDAGVINLSLGSEQSSEAIADAVAYAVEHDVVVVAAAGNIDEEGQGIPLGYPARLPGVVAVTGITAAGKHWHNSSRGPRAALCAPATGVIGPIGDGYEYLSGTSFAAPMVAAAAALVRAKWPGMDAANVINRLLRTADDLGRKGRDSHYGYGRVNLAEAVTAEVPEVRTNPLLLGSGQKLQASKEPSAAAAAAPPPTERGSSGAGAAVWSVVMAILLALMVALTWLLWRRRAAIPALLPTTPAHPAAPALHSMPHPAPAPHPTPHASPALRPTPHPASGHRPATSPAIGIAKVP